MARAIVLALLLQGTLVFCHQNYQPRYQQSHAPQTYSPLECRVDDPLSCSQAKGEVCVFSNGQYRCQCPPGINRLGDGRCKLINECSQPKLNTCHKDAMCIDKTDGYTCQCNSGFADVSSDRVNKPGRICQRTQNECGAKQTYGVDCDSNSACVDTPEGFQCVCQPGYTDISASLSKSPGRKCVEVVNECLNGEADCSANADCIDTAESYDCRCRHGFVDASPDVVHYPGRVCNMPRAPEYYGRPATPENQCSDSSTCGPNEECRVDRSGRRVCQCQNGAVKDEGGRCKVFSQCERSRECDANAQCSNTYGGVECKCKTGYLDISPDPLRLPGRKCQALINECAEGTADCDPMAECVDTQNGYICRCPSSMTDVSSRYGKQPGRKCSQTWIYYNEDGGNYCKDKSLNSCDENADCVELPDGYTCKCFNGYIDVSSNANLQPGRVCTLHTTCPTQPTDLVFLIDGSGSIGSYIFQTDVLRFVSEFAELFDIGPQKTRVSVVQYSDQIRHEFGLGDYDNAKAVHQGITAIEYLTGLTRTGAAIEHVANEAFSERRGARPQSDSVSRVAIVITDGRSQDNVTIPSNNARRMNIKLFAVGVTNHVLDSELETIAGSRDAMFHVNGFEDLNTRLRSAIQKVACPQAEPQEPSNGACDPSTHTGCDRSKNQVCLVQGGRFSCGCPKGFEIHPITKVCGGDICNPEISTSCPEPEVCEKTPFGNWRCSCAEGWRDPHTGACKLLPPISESQDECSLNGGECGPNAKCIKAPGGGMQCECAEGFERNSKSDKCQKPGTCDPKVPNSCDSRKREQCLPNNNGEYSCQCPANYRRHSVTEICLINECLSGDHDCDANAMCTDTDESYICTCKGGFLDRSPDPARKPGRKCSQERNECLDRTHNCSANAICVDLADGFLCRCKDEYVDVSPNPSAFAGTDCRPLVDECASPEANTCHKDALCTDTRDSYKCQCKEGFVDTDELRNPGRNCQKLNQVCESGHHDCDKNARCIERGAKEYECVCNSGFLDMSKDASKPGRICVERVCLDPTKNDCHPAAICTETAGPEKYTCQCRNGYVDLNQFRKGTECKELLNECLDSSLNDCDPAATCIDKDDGYDCRCPVGTKDTSPDTAKPGRVCFGLVDECRNPQLNNCSRFADCVDKEEGYECHCKAEYHDNDPEHPGTDCKFIINECASENLNDCDVHAECIDTKEGYECKCKSPYVDMLTSNPGRVCRFNECDDPKTHECDPNAECVDTDDGYICKCKLGFYDESSEPNQQGKVCIGLSINEPEETEPTTLSPNLFACGNEFCRKNLNEVCIGGEHCGCRPGESRKNKDAVCEKVVEIPIVIRVTDRDGEKLHYSSDFGSPTSPNYIEIVDDFVRGLGTTVKKTKFSPKYVSSDVNYITNPKVENSTWNDGLLVNGTLRLKPDADKCEVWKELTYAISEQSGKIATLQVADDNDKLDPCREQKKVLNPDKTQQEDEIKGIACGNTFCNIDLGEECVAGRVCACPKGQKRADANSKCRIVESWNLPLWVVRDKDNEINYSVEMANPQNNYHKELVDRFEKGIAESYKKTPLGSGFVVAEVNDIENPSDRNKTWESGILYNFTTHFVKGSVDTPSKVFTDLVQYIIHKNNYEVGKEKLFISPDQMNPFGACYNSDCGENAVCKETGKGGYTCSCPSGFRDLDASHPGHKCLSFRGVNECEDPSLNECSANARCIDLDYLYKCECNAGYSNAAPEGKVPGSVCVIDFCSDVNYCPGNSTCKNVEEQALCECLPGFVDVRKSERLVEAKLDNNYCLRLSDVDECALGLHNCSAAATCIDKKVGYECRCNDGFEDGNPAEPGRICAARLCGQCNGHGDCVHDANSEKITCACLDGYTGEFCENAPSKAGLILATILALLFLLLALLCCLWMCCRTRCFGVPGGSGGSASGQEILGSDYYTIPRAKLKPAYAEDMGHDNAGALAAYLDDGASISSDGSMEEIERRVTTDVTTREIRTTTVTDEHGNVHTTQAEVLHNGRPVDSMETEAEQFAMTSSDHFTHAVAGGASSSAAHAMRSQRSTYDEDADSMMSEDGGATVDRSARMNQHHEIDPSSGMERRRNEYSTQLNSHEADYASVADLNGKGSGNGDMDRNTRFNQHHEFIPGSDPRTGVERRRNEMVTTTTSNEVNYFD